MSHQFAVSTSASLCQCVSFWMESVRKEYKSYAFLCPVPMIRTSKMWYGFFAHNRLVAPSKTRSTCIEKCQWLVDYLNIRPLYLYKNIYSHIWIYVQCIHPEKNTWQLKFFMVTMYVDLHTTHWCIAISVHQWTYIGAPKVHHIPDQRLSPQVFVTVTVTGSPPKKV